MEEGATVAVFGLGAVGLAVIQVCGHPNLFTHGHRLVCHCLSQSTMSGPQKAIVSKNAITRSRIRPLSTQAAKLRNARRIFAIDMNPSKFEIAKKLGATDCLNPKDHGDKPIQTVRLQRKLDVGSEVIVDGALI